MYAQTLAQAKAFYEKGEYAKAKPIFKKFATSQPANGNYSLWYGVCCLKTNEPDVALKYLENAVKKRIPSGQLYLGQNYHALYRFEDAIEVYNEYIADLTRRKRPTQEAEELLKKSKAGMRLLKGVEEVCIIDSIVADKKEFLASYKISPEAGQLYMYNAYFHDNKEAEGIVYETELKDRIYYSEHQPDSTTSILSSNKMLNEWSTGSPLPEPVNSHTSNANYPYVMTDGVTLFYASDGENSIGGYDIFVTRYNSENDTYLTPQNVGMPFNSPYNDYMYVIDEYNNLGWFASDRYQPEGKVCIYVFIPNSSKMVYEYENVGQKKLIRLASLRTIKETWTDNNAVAEARQRLQTATHEQPEEENKHEFEFVIDDSHTYHHADDFRSAEAKGTFEKYRTLEIRLVQARHKLANSRSEYMRTTESEKKRMTPAMLDLEKRIELLTEEMNQTAMLIRKQEISTF